jgi:hypothetical protein
MKIDPKGLAKKTKGSGTILFSEFSAFSLNKMKKFELSLEGANNPLMKQKRIKEFVENFDEGLPEILGATGEAENSQIFGPLVQSIGQMNGSGKKVVLLFSDMIENGGETSFYRGDPAKSDREKLEKQYGLKMPDLKGYEVYIVYNPAVNPGTSELARKSAQFFKSWMEERGAKVKTVANLL